MRDDLIGFVVGALDADEHEKIRRRVEQDKELQRQVKLVERSLRPLAAIGEPVEPPIGLVQRTCAQLTLGAEGQTDVDSALVSADGVERSEPSGSEMLVAKSWRSNWGADRAELNGNARRWTVADFVVAAGVCLAAACLFFPALANSRYHSQLASCQNNMRHLGTALIDYSGNAGGYFPVIPPSGNLSFSGVYAAKLAAKGLVTDPRTLLCPAKGNTVVVKIPPLRDIAAAQGPRLVRLHHTMGGDYAYALGFVKNGNLYGVRNRGIWNAAILSDSPIENLRNVSVGTHGRGQNVLFSDGHIRFLATRRRPGTERDDLFFNDEGIIRAGLHVADTVLAPSYVTPLPVADGRVLP